MKTLLIWSYFPFILAHRGVDPQFAAKLLSPNFNCLDGSGTKGQVKVNDDYCDCLDGSDEPGTAACFNGSFYCANKGFSPAMIPSSRVDDGICDYKCCDGSDETPGKCPSRCQELAKDKKEREDALEAIRKLGAQAKLRLIDKAMEIRLSKTKELGILRKSLGAKEQELKIKKEELEALESQPSDDPAVAEPPSIFKSILKVKDNIVNALSWATSSSSTNVIPISSTSLATEATEASQETAKPLSTEEEAQDVKEREEATEASQETEEEAQDVKEREEATEASQETEEEAQDVKEREGKGKVNEEVQSKLSESRFKYNQAKQELDQAKNKIEEIEKVLKGQNGKRDVYLALRDTCLEKTDDYNYKFCWFKDVTQDNIVGVLALILVSGCV
jgi:protein kinase C substrate 80K-H